MISVNLRDSEIYMDPGVSVPNTPLSRGIQFLAPLQTDGVWGGGPQEAESGVEQLCIRATVSIGRPFLAELPTGVIYSCSAQPSRAIKNKTRTQTSFVYSWQPCPRGPWHQTVRYRHGFLWSVGLQRLQQSGLLVRGFGRSSLKLS